MVPTRHRTGSCPSPRGRLTSLLLVAGLLAAWSATPALAQPPWAEAGENRKEHFELLRMWRLVDELAIDEQQAERVFPVFRRHRVQRDSLAMVRIRALTRLRKQLEGDADEAELSALILQARAAAVELRQAEEGFAAELTTVLSTRQQAQLLLFDSSFRSDLQDVVRRMRGGGRQAPEGPERGPTRGAGRQAR